MSKKNDDFYFILKKVYDNLKKISTTYYLSINDIMVTDKNMNHIISPIGTFKYEDYIKYTNTVIDNEIKETCVKIADEDVRLKLIPIYKKEVLKYFCFVMFDKNTDLIYIISTPATNFVYAISKLGYCVLFNSSLIAYNNKNDNVISKMENFYNKYKDDEILNKEHFSYINYNINDFFSVKLNSLPIQIIYKYDYMKDSGYRILFINLIALFLMLSFSSFLFFKIFKWLYSPIKDTLENINIPNEKFIDEFQLIKENMQQIDTLYDELSENELTRKKLEKQNYYRELLFTIPDLDCPLTSEEMEAKYCLALIEFSFEYKQENVIDLYLNLQKNIIYMYIKELEDKYNIYCIGTNNNALTIVMQTSEQSELKAILNNILQMEEITFNMYIAMSSIKESVLKLNLCYEEAVNIMDYKYQLAENEILTLKDIESIPNASYYYPLALESRLIQAIINGKDIALVIFDKIIQENLSANLSHDVQRNFTYALINTIMRCFQELKTTPQAMINQEIDVINLYANWNNNNIYQTLRNYISSIINTIKNNISTNDETIYKKMLSFIYENYNDDIMLTDIAEHCNITAPYCSSIFKKYNLDNYKNFLNKYRIQKACEILNEQPNIKIQDLSLMVGFNSANSFIRVFRKYMNISPKLYIENKMNNTDN